MKKKKFSVYIEGTGYGCYCDYREFVGDTYAVSKLKAISNIKYRMRQEGKPLPCDIEDAYGRGYITFKFVVAEE